MVSDTWVVVLAGTVGTVTALFYLFDCSLACRRTEVRYTSRRVSPEVPSGH